MKPSVVLLSLALALVLQAASASAMPWSGGEPQAFVPRVPISALARPVRWLDPSRFHVASSVSVGSGFGGGVNALQTVSLSYRFGAPVWMNLTLGNAWGAQTAGSRSPFLEGMDLTYRPSRATFFEIRYRNVRSPLQAAPGTFGDRGP